MTTTEQVQRGGRIRGCGPTFVTGMMADAPADIQDSVALMVSELATNALVHASGGFAVSVERSDGSMFVSISDRGEAPPSCRHRRRASHTGVA